MTYLRGFQHQIVAVMDGSWDCLRQDAQARLATILTTDQAQAAVGL
jgi:hypothetical protein